MPHELTLEMGGAGGEFSPPLEAPQGAGHQAHSGGGDAGESHQLVAAVRRAMRASDPTCWSAAGDKPPPHGNLPVPTAILLGLALAILALAAPASASVRVKELADVQGVRDNELFGYGLVV